MPENNGNQPDESQAINLCGNDFEGIFCVKGSLDATHIFLGGSKLIDANALGVFLRDLPAKFVHCLGWCHVMTHVEVSMLKGKI